MRYQLKQVQSSDAALLRELASQCEPLDLHTPYTYWVLANYAADTSFILYDGDVPAGFITSLVRDKLGFIWQIGLLAPYRKQKLSPLLIDSAVQALRRKGVLTVETTIAEENLDSYNAFRSYCNAHGVSMTEKDIIDVLENGVVHHETRYVMTFAE